MHRSTRLILLALLGAFLAYSAVFTLALVSQLADAADRIYTGSGQWVFGALLLGLLLAVLVPTVLVVRLPAALRPPTSADAAAQAHYRAQLRQHLARNPHLAGFALDSEADITHALQHLQTIAEGHTRAMAASVLASTALLQNGKLDALVVLASQVRLVWRIARVYGLRPSLRQLSYLYGNVGACMVLAGSLDSLDFAELASPIAQATTPAALASVPGLGVMGSLLTNSLASGAANAFLTLRVGLMAQAYCAPLHQPERAGVRRSATVRAASLLGQIVRETGARVSQAVVDRLKGAVAAGAQSTLDGVRNAGQGVADTARSAVQSSSDWVGSAGERLQNASLSVADHTARAADAVQRSTQQASANTRSKWSSAMAAIKRKR